MILDVAVHRWPLVAKAPHNAAVTAKSRSASSITICAFLPPISNEQRFKSFPQVEAIHDPTSDEPVNDTKEMSLCCASGAPASLPKPVTTFMTPAGNPASAKISANNKLMSGVSSAGFNTTVFPQISAG